MAFREAVLPPRNHVRRASRPTAVSELEGVVPAGRFVDAGSPVLHRLGLQGSVAGQDRRQHQKPSAAHRPGLESFALHRRPHFLALSIARLKSPRATGCRTAHFDGRFSADGTQYSNFRPGL